MGFFSVKTKSKKIQSGDKSGDPKPSLKIKTSRPAVISSIALSTPPSSPRALQPSDPSLFDSSINPPLTPPPTPITTPQSTTPTCEQQTIRPRSASAPEIHSSKTNVRPKRSSSFLSAAFSKSKHESRNKSFSSTLFQTPAQRKRREKREGKLPAILSDYETPLPSDSEQTTEPTNSSYASLESEGICDPSSSTTYSLPEKKSRNRRQKDNKPPTSLRLTMLQMTL